MVVAAQDIEARVRSLVSEPIQHAGLRMVDLEYRREAGGWTLRLYIDKQGGVTLEDCQKVSHEIGTLLEVEDPIPNHFTLEVSSPGLNRPLKTEEDFQAAMGRLVKITSRQPIAGQRHFTGKILETRTDPDQADAARIALRQDDGKDIVMTTREIEKAHIVHEWPDNSPRKPGRRSKRGAGGSGPQGASQ